MASVKLTLHDAIELFPEIKPELPRLLEGRTVELKHKSAQVARMDEIKTKHFNRLWKQGEYQRAIALEATVDKSRWYKEAHALQLQVYSYETVLKKRDGILPEEISRAKQYPLAQLLPAGKRGRGRYHLCPFHNEKSPSFHIFKDNGYSCFGCNKHGDTISFVMDLYHLDFKSAVRAINSYGL